MLVTSQIIRDGKNFTQEGEIPLTTSLNLEIVERTRRQSEFADSMPHPFSYFEDVILGESIGEILNF